MNSSSWHIKEFDPQLVDIVAKEFGVPNAIAKIMTLRGVTTRDISSNFFTPKKDSLHESLPTDYSLRCAVKSLMELTEI